MRGCLPSARCREEMDTRRGADLEHGQWAVLDLLNKGEVEWKRGETKVEKVRGETQGVLPG